MRLILRIFALTALAIATPLTHATDQNCDRFDAITDLKDGVDVSAEHVLQNTPQEQVAPLKNCLNQLIQTVQNSQSPVAKDGLDPAADIHAEELLDQLSGLSVANTSRPSRAPASN